MKTDSETLRLGDEESPYFRQFQADMEAHGGVVFDASGPPMPLLIMDRTGKLVRIPVPQEETPQEGRSPQRKL